MKLKLVFIRILRELVLWILYSFLPLYAFLLYAYKMPMWQNIGHLSSLKRGLLPFLVCVAIHKPYMQFMYAYSICA